MSTPFDSSASSQYRPAIVAGRYRVSGILAQAEHHDVVHGVDVKEDRAVVMKRLRRPSRNTTTRLRTVHRILSGLRHPSVMEVRDLREGKRDSWIISDQVPGDDLLTWWSRLPLGPNSRFEDRWVHLAPCLSTILDGLEAMHRSQVAHLDLKPANVRVDILGRGVVVDFGFGEPMGEEEPDVDDESELDSWFGFMAPELVDGMVVSRQADQWSLGAILYLLLTGRRPLPGRSVAELLAAYERGRVQPLREWRSDIPEEVESIIVKMLSWEPDHRYDGIKSLRAAFGNLISKPPDQLFLPWSVPAPPVVGREPFEGFFRRRLKELENTGTGALIRLVAPEGSGKTRMLEVWEEVAAAHPNVRLFSAACRPGWPRTALDGWFQPPPCDVTRPPPKDLVEQAVSAIDSPTVVLLDGLEEVDAATWARVHRAAAAASTGTVPLVMVLAGRSLPDLGPRITPEAARFFNAELPPLVPADVAELLRPASAELEDIQVRDRAAEAFCDEARGLPQALLQVFLEDELQGRLVREGQHWVVRVGAGIDEPAPPARPALHDQFLAWIAELGGTVEVEILLSCLTLRRRQVCETLAFAAVSDHVRFRWLDDRWFVELVAGAVSSTVEIYSTPETHLRVARWMEANGDGTGLRAERTGKHWHKGVDYAAAAEAFHEAAAAEGLIGNTADARRLDGIARTLAARAASQRG